jgi:hypothetical protein
MATVRDYETQLPIMLEQLVRPVELPSDGSGSDWEGGETFAVFQRFTHPTLGEIEIRVRAMDSLDAEDHPG